ncbi:MAG: hypothetical protein GY749_50560 [Desulfobacteraceae bacterium]|nr:hypothetical protein [Desulfobacteraceae bacterium]
MHLLPFDLKISGTAGMRKIILAVFFVFSITASTLASPIPVFRHNATFDKSVVPASGRQEAILTVSHIGRYAITVKSPQGTALQLIDRMAGPGHVRGITGEKDGRLDVFLDRGTYKIITHSHDQGAGTVTLEVHPSKELNLPQPPRIDEYNNEHKIIQTSLDDFQQRSYWLDVKKRGKFSIEAAGRNLTDLRLWKEGTWLADITPSETKLEPRVGQPLATYRLMADLNPGLYLLTAYGGQSEPWSETSEEHPLYIRLGVPSLSDAGRRCFVASPFGVDRWLIPSNVNYFRLELPEAESASIQVCGYQGYPFYYDYSAMHEITKKSLPPVAEITNFRHSGRTRLVTVRREAGKAYILQHFERNRICHFKGNGDHWVSTIHSGHGEDSVDATAMLTERSNWMKETLIRSSVINLDVNTMWNRRFNLLDQLTLYIEVKTGGKYMIMGEGAKALFRVEPFLTSRPYDYEPPDFRPGGRWILDPGFYVLTAKPAKKGKGILQLSINSALRPNIFTPLIDEMQPGSTSNQSMFTPLIKKPGNKKTDPAETAVKFPKIRLNSNYAYTLYLNKQPGVYAGVILRRLPIDLTRPLPVTQTAGETLEVTVRIPEKGQLSAIAENGKLLDFSVNQGTVSKKHTLNPETYFVTVTNSDDHAVSYALVLTPERLSEDVPLPVLSPGALESIPDFPVLGENDPLYFNLTRKEQKTFQVKVDNPALFRLESTGLLETEGNIRTRTNPSLDRQSNNGVGRNFLVQQYLREGDYQLTIKTRGKTRGHLGLDLSPTRMNDGAWLTDGVPARHTLPAGEGIVCQFNIKEKGKYRLQSIGLNRSFRMRLEDADGWPLIAPGAPADYTQEFLPGSYRLVILPQPVDARVVTLLKYLPPEIEYKGHGPHTVSSESTGQKISHRWMEPDPGKEHIPDQWRFTVPGPVDTSVWLSEQMYGRLRKLGHKNDPETSIRISAQKGWNGRLETGEYSLDVQSLYPNNRLDYSFKIDFKQLVPGHTRKATAPANIPVSVGQNSLIEISSFGNQDVRARLYNKDRELVAQNDDRTGDWNFHIAHNLSPGMYQLRLDPVGSNSASTTVSMVQPEDVKEPVLSLPASLTVTDNKLHTYPLELSEKNLSKNRDILFAVAASRDSVRISLEQKQNKEWQTLGISTGKTPRLAVALDKKPSDSQYRLRLQSMDRRGASIRLEALTLSPIPEPERLLTGKGVTLSRVKNIELPTGIAAVKLNRPGVFRIEGPDIDTLAWTGGSHRQLSGDSRGLVVAGGDILWIMDESGKEQESKVRVTRVQLRNNQKLQLTLPPNARSAVDIAPENSGPLLIVADSRLGQPGVASDKIKDSQAGIYMGISRQSAVSVDLNSAGTCAKLWNAGDFNAPLVVSVCQYSFGQPKPDVMTWGVNDTLLGKHQAGAYKLPPGLKRIRLVLPESAAAALSLKEKITGVHWAGDQPIVKSFDTWDDHLTLLNTHTGPARVSATLTPLKTGEALAGIYSRTLIKHYFASAGIFSLNVKLSDSEKQAGILLKIQGNDISAALTENRGWVKQGQVIRVNDNAVLDIQHGSGLLTAWLEGGEHNPWEHAKGKAVEVVPPEQVHLKGQSMKLKFKQTRPAMLHLKAALPIVAYIRAAANTDPRVELFPDGADMAVYLPYLKTADKKKNLKYDSDSYITLQSAGKGELSGTAELIFTEITSLGEGPGPKIQLSPGDSRLFSFSIENDRTVGMGVRSSADIAVCKLMDNNGRVLGTGVVQMHELTSGSYLMAVEIPSDGVPVEIQPVIVGIEPPEGPPAEVVQKYLDMAGLKNP